MSTTLADLRTLVVMYTNDPDGTWENATYIDPAVNAAYREIALWLLEISPKFLLKSTTITRVTDTKSYSLPDDFMSVQSLTDAEDTPWPEIDGSRYTYYNFGYWIEGSLIYCWPDTDSTVLTLKYNYLPVKLTTGSSALVLPDYFADFIAIRATMKIKGIDDEFEGYQYLGQEYKYQKELIEGIASRSSHGHHSTRDVYGGVR
jgi:hypothetical protein